MKIEKLNITKYKFEGNVVITDPCYVFGGIPGFWDTFCSILFEYEDQGVDIKEEGLFVTIDSHVVFICNTCYGDGRYPLIDRNGKTIGYLPVDAGLLSVIPEELVRSISDFTCYNLVQIIEGGVVLAQGNGDFQIGDYIVITSDFDEDRGDDYAS
jgi:hypothetical protein